MTIEAALQEIQKFWPADDPLPFGGSSNDAHRARLETEFGTALPAELADYVTRFAPPADFYLDTVGNPMSIYSVGRLGAVQDGYNYNPVTQTVIDDWPASYFLIADEGADPVLIDLQDLSTGVQKLEHGAGSWEYGATVADTIGQFLLCCAAQHHALTGFGAEPIIDDANGFNLAPAAAAWYFPRMKQWAGAYYREWCLVFNNH